MSFSEYFRKKVKKKSVLWWIIVPFTALFLCFVLVMSYLLTLSNEQLQDEMYTAHESTFNAVSANIESMKKGLDSFSQQVSSDTSLLSIAESYDWESNNVYYDILNMKQNLEKSRLPYEYIKNISVYFPRDEKIVIDGGVLNALREYKNYFFSKQITSDGSFEGWKDFMNRVHSFEMYRCDDGKLYYIHSVLKKDYPLATMFIEVNDSFFRKLSGQNVNNSGLVVYNHIGEVIYFSGLSKAENPLIGKELDFDKRTQLIEESDASYILFLNSNPKQIDFTYYMEEKEFYEPAENLTTIFYTLVMVFLLLAVGLSFLASKLHYRSVSGIMDELKKVSTDETGIEEIKNEYDYIRSSVHSLSKQLMKSEVAIKKQNKTGLLETLRKHFVNPYDSAEFGGLLDVYHIDFFCKNYVCALITVNYADENYWTLSRDSDLIFTATENIFADYSGEDFNSLAVPIDESVFLFIIGTEKDDKKDILGSIKKHFEEEKRFCEENLKFDFYVHISDVYSDMNMTKAIYEKLHSTNYIDTENAVTFINDIPKNSSYDYGFLDATESALKKCLEDADYEGAKRVLDRLYKENKGSVSGAFSSYINIRVMNIFSDFTKMLEPDKVQEYLDYISRINPKRATYKDFVSLAQHYCEITAGSVNTNINLSEAVKDYVNKHFSDRTLNVNTLGYEFGKTPGYLSGIFKAETGKMLNQYISETRLQHAKILLLTDKKVDKIADECGFSDTTTFRRTFKRIVGITPSEFRKQAE